MKQIKGNLNYWAHENFLDFAHIDNWKNSKEYQKSCDKLQKDHDRVFEVFMIVAQIRLDYLLQKLIELNDSPKH